MEKNTLYNEELKEINNKIFSSTMKFLNVEMKIFNYYHNWIILPIKVLVKSIINI